MNAKNMNIYGIFLSVHSISFQRREKAWNKCFVSKRKKYIIGLICPETVAAITYVVLFLYTWDYINSSFLIIFCLTVSEQCQMDEVIQVRAFASIRPGSLDKPHF